MVAEKGLPGPVADRIGEFVVLKGGPREVLQTLQAPGHPLNENPDGKVQPFLPISAEAGCAPSRCCRFQSG